MAFGLVLESAQVVFSKTINDLSDQENLNEKVNSNTKNVLEKLDEKLPSDTKRSQENLQDKDSVATEEFLENRAPNDRPNPKFSSNNSKPANLSCLTEGGFYQAVKALGVLDLPGIRLVKVSNAKLRHLMKYKKITKPTKLGYNYHKKHGYKKYDGLNRDNLDGDAGNSDDDGKDNDVDEAYDDDANGNDADKTKRHSPGNRNDAGAFQKRVYRSLCQETLQTITILANYNENLVYEIQTRSCQGSNCQSEAFTELSSGASLGRCTGIHNTILLYTMDQANNLIPRSETVGAACKCMTPFP